MRKQTTTSELALYTFVFKSRISKAAVLSLFLIMCIQPVSLAYAAEDESAETFDTMEISSVVNEEIAEDNPPEDPIIEESNDLIETSSSEESETEEITEETEVLSETVVAVDMSMSEDDNNSDASEDVVETVSEHIVEHATATSTDQSQVDNVLAEDGEIETATTSSNGNLEESASSTETDTDAENGGSEDVQNSGGSNTDSGGEETVVDEDGSDTATTTNTNVVNESEIDTASSTDGIDDAVDIEGEVDASTTATTTAEMVEVVTPVYATAINDNNFYQFSKAECVTVGDGSFYCGVTEDAVAPLEDTFFAAQDSDGDLEIFARKDGQEYQITHNVYDDAAPHYDATSETIVWHRLIEDRYQIMSYDFASEKETQLTKGGVNNMEPTRFGDVTVWQRWGGNNWEIMINHGGITEQLTNNIYHDIAPSIRSGYVLWKTIFEENQQVSVYDIETREITTIHDAEASISVSNPRMVLMYDALTDAGDVVTRGYDPVTGEIIPLGVLPVELPEEMPESDQTGETRALIQTKSTTTGRESSEDEMDDDIAQAPEVATSTESAATTSDIIVPAPTESATSTNTDISASSSDVYIEKPVVSPAIEASSTVDHIPDVVIPPATTTNSQ